MMTTKLSYIDKVKDYVFLLFLLLSVNSGRGQSCIGFPTNDQTFSSENFCVEYDPCTGEMIFYVKMFAEFGAGTFADAVDFDIGFDNKQIVSILRNSEVGYDNYPGEEYSFGVSNPGFKWKVKPGGGGYNVDVRKFAPAGADYFRIKVDDLPSSQIGAGNKSAYINYQWARTDCGCENSGTHTVMISQSGKPSSSPSGFSASDMTNCDGIELNWTNPTVICNSNSKNFTVIERRPTNGGSWAQIAAVAFPAVSYTDSDNGLQKGVSYNYRLKHRFDPNSNRSASGPYSSVNTGSLTTALSAPTDVDASNDDCSEKVVVRWTYNGAVNLGGFILQRRLTNSADPWVTVDANISSSLREYEDTPPLFDVEYDYRLITRNICTPSDNSIPSPATTGEMPGPPIEPVVDSIRKLESGFSVHWSTPANDVNTGFIIERTVPGGGSPFIIRDISATATSYVDTDVVQCVSYTYRVKATSFCYQDGRGNSQITGLLSPDLNGTFGNDDSGFGASKGYFSDKVELTWQNQNEGLTNTTKIFRRVLGSQDGFSLLTTLNGGSGIYNDLSADAGELYEYEIVAEAPCENTEIESNRVRTIGFRRKTGVVTGKVSYEGGVVVENVKIAADDPSSPVLSSLRFSGVDSATIDHSSTLEITDDLILETWINPSSYTQDFEIIRKGGAYKLAYVHSNESITFEVETDNGIVQTNVHKDSLPTLEWSHVAATMTDDSIALFLNGLPLSSISTSPNASINPSNSDIVIGNGFDGFLKEIRIWNTAKTNDRISQDLGRFLAGGETGLRVYLNAAEGRGEYSYDLSKINSLFNKNHAKLSNPNMWALNEAPSVNQLSVGAFTDDNGNYNLVVPYSGVGQNFVLTPIFGTHVFDPSTRSVFIGDGASVQNGIDFLDISAFPVTGRILYDGTNCPSKDVFVKIDGEVVIENGNPVRTEPDGTFSLDVPIGEHIITLEKNGHVFSEGRFPGEGEFDFQEPVSGIEFKDSTLRTVIGRVVGGRREGDKVPGLGRSANNIGVANLTFDPTQNCGWIADESLGIINQDTLIRTDSLTGEYAISLPPIQYLVSDVEIGSNAVIDLGPAELLDLSNLPFLQTVVDTLFQEGTANVISIDSISFHKQHDYIYRASPSVDVSDRSGNGPLVGDDKFLFSHTRFGNDTISLSAAMLPYPVFTQNKRYTAKISTFEEYINKDGVQDIIDRVPVTDGILTINNELAAQEEIIIDLSQELEYNGDTLYTFFAGQPNIAENVTTPELSFTRPFKVDLVIGSQSDSWRPLSTHDNFYRGYVMGAKDLEQSDFVTQGPEIVSYILRDPPGSQSSATRSVGTTTSNTVSYSLSTETQFTGNRSIKAGSKFESGVLGFTTETKVEAEATEGLEITGTVNSDDSITEEVTNTQTWSTSAEPLLAGAQSDLFIGNSRNYLFGKLTSLRIVPTSVCGQSTTLNCIGTDYNGYSVALEESIAIAQGDIQTTFIYTRNKIETDEIPDLQVLRNSFLSNNNNYVSNLGIDHPCYGFNNDDPRFADESTCPNTGDPSTDTPSSFQSEDLDGPSYTLIKPSDDYIDTIRNYNQQIRLWEQALILDEKEKLETTDGGTNYSFGGGGATFSNTSSSARTVENSWGLEFQAEASVLAKLQIESAGIGFGGELGISITQGYSKSRESSLEDTYEIGYTIADDSEWDDFSFDVYPPSNIGGPIFKTIGGRTSCPWEGPVLSKYHMPGSVLSPGTIKLEQPEISISPSVLYNVPQDEVAVFTMTLTNNNTVGEGWEYATKLLPETNPNSLEVNLGNSDDLTRTWVIPAQSSITRDIFVGIGNAYDYSDLVVAFHSTCQYQQGLSEEEDIVDEATFSVSFVPECTEIALSNPEDNWVLNNSFNNTLNLIASDYNINHLNLDNITIDYKPSNETDWIQLEKFYYDTTGMGDPTALQIDRVSPLSLFTWDVEQIPDGPYDLRATSDCTVDIKESPVYSGRMDRINPHAFGTPSPADGILDPNDDILITFNETIDNGTASLFNFDVRGVLNGTVLRHAESLSFDGSNDFGQIPAYQLQKRSFTVEFWVKKTSSGAATILSQGASANDQLLVAIDNNDKIKFQLGDVYAVSDGSIGIGTWHHVAISYNRELSELSFFIDNALEGSSSNFVSDYTGSGDVYIGQHVGGTELSFTGELHELRLWSVARTLAEIAPKSSVVLSGREEGLIGNWPMNEAYGDLAFEKVRSRHMLLNGPTWAVAPASHAYQLDGVGDYLKVTNAGLLSMSDESDITIEGWIKTPGNGQKMTILSNGDPSTSRPSAWNISMTASGQLQIENNGEVLEAAGRIDDDDWHHFAIVLERSRALTIYVDREVILTYNAAPFDGYGGAALYLGVKGYQSGSTEVLDNYFQGSLDDIRIWNVARRPEQIERDFNNQLTGDEPGLLAYYPFDDYRLELGVPVLDQTLTDASEGDFDLTAIGGGFTTSTPTMRLPRPIEKVNFTYSINDDQIFIEPTDPANRLENVTLDITVKGIRDLAGNYMESPETWIAYVDQNQVFWDTEYFEFEKSIDGEISFTAVIRNTGGRQERFDLSNLPVWMSASPISGIIDPNSSLEVDFTISNLVDLGSYEQDIFVTTESVGFNERLLIDLLVEANPPVWEVEDPDQYPGSMNYIGEIIIDGAISTDERDMIVAYVNDTIRGVAHVERNTQTGKHLVFLVIQGGRDIDALADEGKEIVFKVWDASEDKVHPYVAPTDDLYQVNDLRGSLGSPVAFATTGEEELIYTLNRGWNWISFPIEGDALKDINDLLSEINVVAGDRITNHRESGIYLSQEQGWILNGSLNRDGLNVKDGYRFYISEPDTFSYRGLFKDPSTLPIPLTTGWNSIGVISENNIDVATALASLDPQDGDIIKGQKAFAVYESAFGWSGPLKLLQPKESYMLKVQTADDLIYPNLRTPKSKSFKVGSIQEELYTQFDLQPELYESTMSMVVTVEGFSDWSSDNEWYVAAYVGEDCRGVDAIRMDEGRGTRLAYISLYGDASEDIQFFLISKDGKQKIPINEEFKIITDGFLGVPSSPVILTVPTSPCNNEVVVNHLYSLDENQSEIQATSTIRMSAMIDRQNLSLKAGEAIELLPGFESMEGAEVQFFITPCDQ